MEESDLPPCSHPSVFVPFVQSVSSNPLRLESRDRHLGLAYVRKCRGPLLLPELGNSPLITDETSDGDVEVFSQRRSARLGTHRRSAVVDGGEYRALRAHRAHAT